MAADVAPGRGEVGDMNDKETTGTVSGKGNGVGVSRTQILNKTTGSVGRCWL